jgi:hypothetical protein
MVLLSLVALLLRWCGDTWLVVLRKTALLTVGALVTALILGGVAAWIS